MAVTTRSLPSIDISFPHTITDLPSPVKYGSSDIDFSPPERIELPTSMTSASQDPQSSPQKQVSFRWRTPHGRSRSSSTTAVSSKSSATTSVSTFPRIIDFANRGRDASSELKDVPVGPQRHDLRMGGSRTNENGTRSVFRVFAKSLSQKSSTSRPEPSQSCPTTPNASADGFSPHPILARYSSSIQHEHALASLPQGINALTDPVHKPSHSSLPMAVGKRHRGAAKHTAKLSRKSNPPSSQTKSKVSFDAAAQLTPSELEDAGQLEVLDQEGRRVKFENIWKDRRTCVIFIRHFWCHLCMDYTRSIVEHADPDALRKAGVGLVVISNGSPGMIKSYIKLVKFPYPMYTDPSLAVYRALGMTLRTLDAGPDSERGEYVKHGTAAGIAIAVKHAVQGRLPVHKAGGDIRQLGGEFVLGPGIHCTYTSRMHNTRSHAPILDVLSAAGVDPISEPVVDVQPQIFSDEQEWMRYRDDELRRIRAKKGLRRGLPEERRSGESAEFESEWADADWRDSEL